MRAEHPNTHLVEEVILSLRRNAKTTGSGEVIRAARKVTVRLIVSKFKADYPQAEMPSERTIANIKKRLDDPERYPSNLCEGCMGYGHIYEQTKRYFGDGTEVSVPNRPHAEIACHVCEGSGIDPNWQKPVSQLITKMGASRAEIAEIISSTSTQPLQDITYEEPLERTL